MPEMLPVQLSMTTATQTECPECGSNGKTVKPITVQALLTREHAITHGGWRFCDSPDCEVVYFCGARSPS